MTVPFEQFPYVEVDPSLGPASALPYMPLGLQYGQRTISISALVDSGAALNVLAYDAGLQLGLVWEQLTIPVRLTGNLADSDARAVVLTATVGALEPVRLAFAWTQNREVPVILGQVNFFMEFDVYFYRSRSLFEVRPQGSGKP